MIIQINATVCAAWIMVRAGGTGWLAAMRNKGKEWASEQEKQEFSDAGKLPVRQVIAEAAGTRARVRSQSAAIFRNTLPSMLPRATF
jgi:hypothetical protein